MCGFGNCALRVVCVCVCACACMQHAWLKINMLVDDDHMGLKCTCMDITMGDMELQQSAPVR